ncbi:pseudouridine synthase [Sorangium sp. So ce375]|uniref:pseudouridine synthase n=1 Tax=Sorangium sp. So ce375 TaxID=3133306 RepID=UPI003F5B8583
MQLSLLHLDDRTAAFAKPSGLLVHRGWGSAPVVFVDLAERALGRKVFPVHRLDRATSGVLLVALDAAAAALLCAQFEQGLAQKRYLALVRGVPPERGCIDHPIPRREGGPRVPAVTDFERLHALERYAVVEARPRTGRLHQVRRHLKHISHPIIGDVNYGKGEHNRLFRERYALHRLALHAAELAVAHPETGAPLRIAAPLPDDLRGPFEQLGVPAWIGAVGAVDAVDVSPPADRGASG